MYTILVYKRRQVCPVLLSGSTGHFIKPRRQVCVCRPDLCCFHPPGPASATLIPEGFGRYQTGLVRIIYKEGVDNVNPTYLTKIVRFVRFGQLKENIRKNVKKAKENPLPPTLSPCTA